MAESRASILAPIGVRGLREYGGTIAEELNPALKGPRRVRTYKDMTREPFIAASLLGTELLMRQVKLTVSPAEATPAGEEAAAWLYGALITDMEQPWHETLSEILTMRIYGWSAHNILYKLRRGAHRDERLDSHFNDGAYGWAGFDIRSQDSLLHWNLDEEQRVTGFVQQTFTGGGTFTLPAEKCLFFRLGMQKGNPEGVSLLNNVWKPWHDKQQIRSFQNIGIERDLAGYPIIYVPPAIMDPNSPPEIQAMLAVYQKYIMSIRLNENQGTVLPASFDEHGNRLTELLLLSAGGGQRKFNIPEIVQQLNVEMMVAFFTDVMLLGHNRAGTLSLSDNKTTMLGFSLSAILDGICEVLNRQAVARLWRLNGFALEVQPIVGHEDVESVNMADLGQFITQMSTAGFDVLGREAEVWRRAGFAEHSPAQEAGGSVE